MMQKLPCNITVTSCRSSAAQVGWEGHFLLQCVSLVGTVNEIRSLLPRANTVQEGQAVVAGRRALKGAVVKAEPPACTCFGFNIGLQFLSYFSQLLKTKKEYLVDLEGFSSPFSPADTLKLFPSYLLKSLFDFTSRYRFFLLPRAKPLVVMVACFEASLLFSAHCSFT